LVKPHEERTLKETRFLETLWETCSEARAVAERARAFIEMIKGRQSAEFSSWLDRAGGEETPPEVRRFADGLRTDLAAVQAALELPWSNGPVEGHINRLKLLKRQMYGRAKFDLLRCRFLYGAGRKPKRAG
jgi:transposase